MTLRGLFILLLFVYYKLLSLNKHIPWIWTQSIKKHTVFVFCIQRIKKSIDIGIKQTLWKLRHQSLPLVHKQSAPVDFRHKAIIFCILLYFHVSKDPLYPQRYKTHPILKQCLSMYSIDKWIFQSSYDFHKRQLKQWSPMYLSTSTSAHPPMKLDLLYLW